VRGGNPDRDFTSPPLLNPVGTFSVPGSTATGAPAVWVELDGVQRQVQPGISLAEITVIQMAPVGIEGDEPQGEALHHDFGVCAVPTEADGLLGTGFLVAHKARLDLANLMLEGRSPLRNARCFGSSGEGAFTGSPASSSQEGRNGQPKGKSEHPNESSTVKRLSSRKTDHPERGEWLVTLPESVRLAPGATRMLLAELEGPKRRADTPLVYILSQRSYSMGSSGWFVLSHTDREAESAI
jgi:hypothetical protein